MTSLSRILNQIIKEDRMGITIKNREKSIDMGCGGFMNLRRNIAKLLSNEFGVLYENWCRPCSPITDEEGNKILKKFYQDGILTDNDDVIIEFLFASDIDGKITAEGCKRLYELIKDYDDNILYGYVMRPDCAKFSDFKEIIRKSAENNWIVKWY